MSVSATPPSRVSSSAAIKVELDCQELGGWRPYLLRRYTRILLTTIESTPPLSDTATAGRCTNLRCIMKASMVRVSGMVASWLSSATNSWCSRISCEGSHATAPRTSSMRRRVARRKRLTRLEASAPRASIWSMCCSTSDIRDSVALWRYGINRKMCSGSERCCSAHAPSAVARKRSSSATHAASLVDTRAWRSGSARYTWREHWSSNTTRAKKPCGESIHASNGAPSCRANAAHDSGDSSRVSRTAA